MNISRKDYFACLFFISFWIIPITYTGLTYKDLPFMPRVFAYLQRIGHLFPHYNPVWPQFYIQGRSDDRNEWLTLNQDDYFRLKPFGHRTHLQEMLVPSKDLIGFMRGQETYVARQKELADWIARRYSEIYPQRPVLTAVRFVAGAYEVNTERKFEGRWQELPLESFKESELFVFSTHEIHENF